MTNKMTPAAAARIQAKAAKENDGKVSKGGFAARAQAAAHANSAQPNWPSKEPNMPSGPGRDNNPPKK